MSPSRLPLTFVSEKGVHSCLRWYLRNLSQELKTMTTCKGVIIYLVRKECMREGYFVWVPAPVSNSKWFKLEEPFP